MASTREDTYPTALTASLEDYLEAIFIVSQAHGEVRPKDLVERLNVRGASVTGALRTLSDRGLVRHTPYHSVALTAEGEAVAREVYRRHRTLKDFLVRILGVPPGDAEGTACRLEHDVSSAVLDRLVKLADFVGGCPRTPSAGAGQGIPEPGSAPACAECRQSFPAGLKSEEPSGNRSPA